MSALGEYIAGRGEAPSRRELGKLIERHEWFTTARRVRSLVTGEPDPALALPSMFWATVPPVASAPESAYGGAKVNQSTHPNSAPVAADQATSSADLIDRFIEHGGYRIDPSGEAREVAFDIDIDPEMVTEELAAIYRSQGLVAEAEKIERILKSR